MTTNEKRREVARKLRALPIDTYAAINEWEKGGLFIDENLSDEADYSQIHNAVFGCFPAEYMHPGDYKKLHERIADLIDMPKAKREDAGNYWRCGHCGAFSRKDAVTNCFGVIPSRCCGNCGREWER